MRCSWSLLLAFAALGCGGDSSGDSEASGTSTTESATTSSTGSATASPDTGTSEPTPECNGAGLGCHPRCCEGTWCVEGICTDQPYTDTGTDGACDCRELTKATPGCTGTDPIDPDQGMAAWFPEPHVIVINSHQEYACEPLSPSGPDLECSCSDEVRLTELEFGSPDFVVGETWVDVRTSVADCEGPCQTLEYSVIDMVEIIEVTDDCVVGDLQGARFYADRTACQ